MDFEKIKNILEEIRLDLINILKIQNSPEELRTNLMIPIDDFLTIVTHTEGYNDVELSIKLAKGEGCAGAAWENKSTIVAKINDANNWGIPDKEQKKVRKTLACILSIPIFDMKTYDPLLNTGEIKAVLNFDSDEEIIDRFFSLSKPLLDRYVSVLSHYL